MSIVSPEGIKTKRPRKKTGQQSSTMTEQELARELKEALVVLSTSSPDKRNKYRTLFLTLGMDHLNKTGGVNFFFTDGGALGIVPVKTPEQTGGYAGNLNEKEQRLFFSLKDPQNKRMIRARLTMENGSNRKNIFDPKKINIVGMTEDSGWHIDFGDKKDQERKFISEIKKIIAKELRPQDKWLLDKIDETGFPGPNLKPLQEHIQGGFNRLMEIIYEAADKSWAADNLRFVSTINISFVSTKTGKSFTKEFTSRGRILTPTEYAERLVKVAKGEAINSNFVHVQDGQEGEPKPLDMIEQDVLTTSSKDLPCDHARRAFTEWLQSLVGTRKSTKAKSEEEELGERDRPVNIAFVSPDFYYGRSDDTVASKVSLPPDYMIVSAPSRNKLMHRPNAKMLGEAKKFCFFC